MHLRAQDNSILIIEGHSSFLNAQRKVQKKSDFHAVTIKGNTKLKNPQANNHKLELIAREIVCLFINK